MTVKTKAAKYGAKATKTMPANQVAKAGLKRGRRRAERSRAGAVALYGQALIRDDSARKDLREAYDSARKAYNRGSDRRGRFDLSALLEDRKTQRQAARAATALRASITTAGKRRRKPRTSKRPIVAVIAVLATAIALALRDDLRARLLGSSESAAPDGSPPAATDSNSQHAE